MSWHSTVQDNLTAVSSPASRVSLRCREEGHRNSVMWVHDYHLMLLPKMLSDREKEQSKDKRRKTSIIFFLHIPFPTSQIFRCVGGLENLQVEIPSGRLA